MPETEEERKNRLRIKIISMGAAECGKVQNTSRSIFFLQIYPLTTLCLLCSSCVSLQSCLIKRYCEKRFVSKYMSTLGIDFGVTKLESIPPHAVYTGCIMVLISFRFKIDGATVNVNIFDLAGQPFFYEVYIIIYTEGYCI